MTQPRLLGDRYELEGVVGRGGMAEVYRARDLRLDRVVAIKTLRADLARDQTFQARFRREAQSAASLNNPSIVAVYDTGEDMSTGTPIPFIVMEYVDGKTVRELLNEGHRLLPERTLEIVSGVLRALEYSHQAGIVHRDIKPGNVMVTRNGDIKVMDFGIARAMSDSQATMTQTAQVIGTAQYLSPEQARGERVDTRSDLYSTGCLMYELLVGRPPFTGDSPVAIAYQHVRENPIPPSRLDPDLPPWADAIVLKAMAKSPNDRYQTAAEMNADIQRAASGMQVAAAFQPPPQTRADYYGDYQQRAARLAASVATGYGTPYTYYYDGDGAYYYDGDDAYEPGSRRWVPWAVAFVVVVTAIIAVVLVLPVGRN
jgi:serine/threonine protein kinase